MLPLAALVSQLQNANSNVQETRSIASQARVVLRRMGRRAIVNKVCLYFVIALLIVANCLVIYYQYLKSD